MKLITDLTLTVCLISVVSVIILMLSPDRLRREMKTVVAIVSAAAICAALSHGELTFMPEGFENIALSYETLERDRLVQAELEERVGGYISSFLEEAGIECKKVSVGTTIDGQRRIFITGASLELAEKNAETEARATALIKEKIGDIEVKISYGEE